MNKRPIPMLAAIMLLAAACSTTAPTKPSTTSSTRKTPDLSGTWILTTQSRMGAENADMTVRQSGDALTGTLTSPRGTVDYTGSINGNAVAFSFTLRAPGNTLRIDYSGTVEGDTMQGKAVFGNFGEGTFSAKRKGS